MRGLVPDNETEACAVADDLDLCRSRLVTEDVFDVMQPVALAVRVGEIDVND